MDLRRTILPLALDRISAAVRLHDGYLPQWRAADAALAALSAAFAGDFGYEANLIRIATVNTLYGTNLRATHRMAQHVAKVLPVMIDAGAVAIVDAIAAMPQPSDEAVRTHRSFASKFCHFFIDEGRFPIFDAAACRALKQHLEPEATSGIEASYERFLGALQALRAAYSIDAPDRDLDRYLWITGMYAVYARGRRDINRDLLTLFDQSPRPSDLAVITDGLECTHVARSARPTQQAGDADVPDGHAACAIRTG